MHNLLVNRYILNGTLSQALAEEISMIRAYSKVAIVADRPVAVLAATRRQWIKLIRRLKRERSSTLNATKISRLTCQIEWMQTLKFSAKLSCVQSEINVMFVTFEDLVRCPPVYSVVYVTCCGCDEEKLSLLMSRVSNGGRVVIYE